MKALLFSSHPKPPSPASPASPRTTTTTTKHPSKSYTAEQSPPPRRHHLLRPATLLRRGANRNTPRATPSGVLPLRPAQPRRDEGRPRRHPRPGVRLPPLPRRRPRRARRPRAPRHRRRHARARRLPPLPRPLRRRHQRLPLVLGCSVKKNMVPVLDYLGKIGVRRSALTDFLRRYPQVLHASVVVDLAPVVKYLQGMDIKPAHVPRVLERYPELLGFKLEGTMSTSVAYLIGIGVARRELGGVLTRYPEVLGMRVGRVIKPFVEHLEGIGLPTLAVARLIEKRPHILGFSLEDQVKPNVGALVEFGIKEESLASVVAQYPDILGMELRAKLAAQQSLFESSVLVDRDEFGRVIEKMPQAVSLSRSAILKHVEFLKSCGFLLKQVSKMVIGCPQLLALNLDIMKMSFEHFQSEMDRDLEELVDFPAFFTYGLESTIRPRNQMIVKKGLKCSLGWMLNCSDAKFEERMQYDSIGIEEVEAEPAFDMKTLLQLREEDESGSEYDEDADYEDSDDDSF
uniref:Transcription termination factor MTERF4, chloroplastic n=1 Tax=Ananas comosus var. bracteatus TaxID=296719 RepID=A0A6V7PF11_ANACO|nr:unnamed protein product [Ananas comosus var. bracteatus]